MSNFNNATSANNGQEHTGVKPQNVPGVNSGNSPRDHNTPSKPAVSNPQKGPNKRP